MARIAGYERPLVLVAVLIPLIAATGRRSTESTVQDDISQFLGKWHGNSSCVAKSTACQDETVVYRITKLPEKSGYVSVTADKIVSGTAVNMGTLEFHYDQDQRLLVCEYSQGIWRLKVDSGKMEGTLTRPNNILFRRVSLRKDS